MSNRQDSSPSLDYFELRRRHEEYKNRERQLAREKSAEKPESARVRPQAPLTQTEPAVQTESAAQAVADQARKAQETAAQAVEPVLEPDSVQDTVAGESFDGFLDQEVEDVYDAGRDAANNIGPDRREPEDDYPDDDYPDDDYPEDDYGDEDVPDDGDNPNPFDSFIRAFKGLKGRIGRRKGEAEEDDGDEPEPGDDTDHAP